MSEFCSNQFHRRIFNCKKMSGKRLARVCNVDSSFFHIGTYTVTSFPPCILTLDYTAKTVSRNSKKNKLFDAWQVKIFPIAHCYTVHACRKQAWAARSRTGVFATILQLQLLLPNVADGECFSVSVYLLLSVAHFLRET